METNVDEIPAADLHGKVTKSSISSLVGEAVLTMWTVMFLIMHGAAIELSLQLTGQEKLPPFCVGVLSSSAVRSDVDLASFENDPVVGPSTVPLASHDVLVPPDGLCDFLHFISYNLSSSSLPTMTAQFRKSFPRSTCLGCPSTL